MAKLKVVVENIGADPVDVLGGTVSRSFLGSVERTTPRGKIGSATINPHERVTLFEGPVMPGSFIVKFKWEAAPDVHETTKEVKGVGATEKRLVIVQIAKAAIQLPPGGRYAGTSQRMDDDQFGSID